MHIRTQLLASFLGVTLLALAIYGTVTYRIAPDEMQRLETRQLMQRAGELALQLDQALHGNSADDAAIIRFLETRGIAPQMVVALDTPNRVILISPKSPQLQQVVASIARSTSLQAGNGKIGLGDQDYLWSSYPLAHTPYSNILLQPPSQDAH